MAERILVPYDGSKLSERALERVVTKHPGDEVHVLFVIDPVEGAYAAEGRGVPAAERWYEQAQEAARAALEAAESLAADHDVAVVTAQAVGNPHRVILEYVDDHDVDHVVMRRSPVPVTVVR